MRTNGTRRSDEDQERPTHSEPARPRLTATISRRIPATAERSARLNFGTIRASGHSQMRDILCTGFAAAHSEGHLRTGEHSDRFSARFTQIMSALFGCSTPASLFTRFDSTAGKIHRKKGRRLKIPLIVWCPADEAPLAREVMQAARYCYQ
jgi:hypothetical protein